MASHPLGARPRVSSRRRGERSSSPGSRTSRRGASARNVPPPTRMASCRARSRCAWARAASPVIQRLDPSLSAMQPSSDRPSFRVTAGRPSVCRRTKPRMAAAASEAIRPISTSMPRARRCPAPCPSVRGSGSRSAITTRATPARAIRSAQRGPRAERWKQGSSVT